MKRFFDHSRRLVDRQAGALLLSGLIGVLIHNWRLWQRDRTLGQDLADPPAPPALSRTPLVSVLVAAWNERDHIDAHIRSFLALRYPQIELILCAGGDDDTRARAQRYADQRIIVLEQRPGEGKQRALARCFTRARGELIYLTDADCRYDDAALARLLAPLIDEGEQAATGRSRPLDAQMRHALPRYIWAADVASSARSSRYSDGLLGRNAAVTRQAIERIGGLDFVARTGTDYQLARRLLRRGIAIRFVGASVVASEYPATLGVYRRKQSRWLRNLLIHGAADGARADVRRTLQTIATGAVMTLAPLLSLAAGRVVLVVWSLLLAQAVCAKLRAIRLSAQLYRQRTPRRLLLKLVPLTLADFVIWALPALDMLDQRRRARW
jgi:GT2 family glycosyltransferase